MDSGEDSELRKHDVEFQDEPLVKVEAHDALMQSCGKTV